MKCASCKSAIWLGYVEIGGKFWCVPCISSGKVPGLICSRIRELTPDERLAEKKKMSPSFHNIVFEEGCHVAYKAEE